MYLVQLRSMSMVMIHCVSIPSIGHDIKNAFGTTEHTFPTLFFFGGRAELCGTVRNMAIVTALHAHLAYAVGCQLDLCMLPSASVLAIMSFRCADGMFGLCSSGLLDRLVDEHDPALREYPGGQEQIGRS